MSEAAVERRPSVVPWAWVLIYVAVFGIALFSISWSFGDTVPLMQKAAALDWPSAIADAFGRGVEYRPLFMLSIKAFIETVGTSLWVYQGLVLLQFAVVLAVVVWLCRPLGPRRTFAACVAISCLSGLHSTRILFGFWPLNQHSGVLVLLLLGIALTFREQTRRFDWVLGVMALVSMFGLELGLLFAPVMVVLRLARAPGLTWRGVASVLVATGVYIAIRLSLGSEHGLPASHNENGFGFSTIAPDQVRAQFGDPPVLLWVYNVASTFLTVVLSEPRNGAFLFAESLLARDMESWQWFHVGLSALTTCVIMAGLLVAAKGRPEGRPLPVANSPVEADLQVGLSSGDRLLVVLGFALLVFGSGLGFLYTRDRIALTAGVGYALLLYVAVTSLLELPAGGAQKLSRVVLVVLAIGWVVRSGELFFQLRDTAWDYHLEWTTRFEEKGGASEERTALFEALQHEALRRTPSDPRTDPAWTYALFERRFKRSPEAR